MASLLLLSLGVNRLWKSVKFRGERWVSLVRKDIIYGLLTISNFVGFGWFNLTIDLVDILKNMNIWRLFNPDKIPVMLFALCYGLKYHSVVWPVTWFLLLLNNLDLSFYLILHSLNIPWHEMKPPLEMKAYCNILFGFHVETISISLSHCFHKQLNNFHCYNVILFNDLIRTVGTLHLNGCLLYFT